MIQLTKRKTLIKFQLTSIFFILTAKLGNIVVTNLKLAKLVILKIICIHFANFVFLRNIDQNMQLYLKILACV